MLLSKSGNQENSCIDMYFKSYKTHINELRRDNGAIELNLFHEWIMRTKGVLQNNDEQFQNNIMPLITLCEFTPNLEKSPKICLIGAESGQRTLFGDDWAENENTLASTPIDGLELKSTDGYRNALRYGLNYDRVMFKEEGFWVDYERLITPIYLPFSSRPFWFGYMGRVWDHL